AKPATTEADLGALISDTKDEIAHRSLEVVTDRAQVTALDASLSARGAATAAQQSDLAEILAATERASALRRSAIDLADRRDPAASDLALSADAAERAAIAAAQTRGLVAPAGFALARP